MRTDKPIIFSAPMVVALMESRKTQTRRKLKVDVPEPPDADNIVHLNRSLKPAPYLDAYCSQPHTSANPRGMGENWLWWTRDDRACTQFKVGYKPGDLLWVRETWQVRGLAHGRPIAETRIAAKSAFHYRATDNGAWKAYWGPWRTPLHMPRWASRLTLLVTDVRVQRLQNISKEDVLAEGITERGGVPLTGVVTGWHEPFAALWDKLHGDGAWDANPWLVALTFKIHKANIDTVMQERAA